MTTPTDIRRQDDPFTHCTIGQVFPVDVAVGLQERLSVRDDWTYRHEPRNRVRTCHWQHDELPDDIASLLTDEVVGGVEKAVRETFGEEFDSSFFITANMQVPGDGSTVHNDYFYDLDHPYFFTHRLIVYLTQESRKEHGGMLGIFASEDPKDLRRAITPTFNTGAGMAMGLRSFHAVSAITEGTRYSLCFSFTTTDHRYHPMNESYPELDDLAAAVAKCTIDHVPPDVLDDARYALGDTLAAAAYDVDGRPCDEPAGRVGVWWTGRRTTPLAAAFANARAAHANDFDSVQYQTFGHPAVVSVPPLFALFESGAIEPAAVVAGYAVCVEVMSCLGAPFGERLRAAGFHPTAVFGAAGAAAACAWALGADADETEWAMALALSTSIGYDSTFGSPLKSMQVAFAARNGLHAARLARTARDTHLPGSWYRPLMMLVGGRGGDSTHVFAQPWAVRIVPTRCKSLPICGYYDPVLTAWRQRPEVLRDRRSQVTGILVAAPEYLRVADRFRHPTHVDELRFSLAALLALLVHHGTPLPTDFTVDHLAEPGIDELMDLVRVVPAESDSPGAITVSTGQRDWRWPLPASAAIETTWTDIESKLANSPVAVRSADVCAHLRDFHRSTPRDWRELIGGTTR